ncbi:RNA polymerase sigma factor [Pirellulaceae bacterium SH501]
MFTTTHWTAVFQAAKEQTGAPRQHFGLLVQKYWGPLYHFAREQGLQAEDAEDATQGFMQEMLNGELLQRADPTKGRFRTFLLHAWKQYLIDRYRFETREKRGGRATEVPLSESLIPDRDGGADGRMITLEAEFFTRWADQVVENAMRRLEEEYEENDRQRVFQTLRVHLTSELNSALYHQLGEALGITAAAAKVAMHRLKHRFGTTLRDVVAETIDDLTTLEEEIAFLANAVATRTSKESSSKTTDML